MVSVYFPINWLIKNPKIWNIFEKYINQREIFPVKKKKNYQPHTASSTPVHCWGDLIFASTLRALPLPLGFYSLQSYSPKKALTFLVMCSSSSFASTFSLFLTKSPSISRRRNVIYPNSHLFLGHLRPTSSTFRITASITERDLELSSWFNPDQPNNDDAYGGWIFLNSPTSVAKTEKRGQFTSLS